MEEEVKTANEETINEDINLDQNFDYGEDELKEEPKEEIQEEPKEESKEEDDYGNEKSSKLYTEDEVNERINKAVRERLARLERNQTNIKQESQQVKQDFEYNPNSQETWQQQLEKFVEQSIGKISQRQQQEQIRQQELKAQEELTAKFQAGMTRFNDFEKVVSAQPITDPMVHALHAVKDPAAFIYAASKRHPDELDRISRIPNAYAQIAEMGKLEERMRRAKVSTSAPRPSPKTSGDSNIKYKSDKEESIEDLIAQSDRERLKSFTR